MNVESQENTIHLSTADNSVGVFSVEDTINIESPQDNYIDVITEQNTINVDVIENEIVLEVTEKGDKGDPGVGVPTGGAGGQVLSKKSDSDFDTEWVDQSGGGSPLTVVNLDGTNQVDHVTKIKLDQDTGISVTDDSIPGEVTIGLGSSFKYILVDGQDTLVAVGEDTMEIIAGDNITLETHADYPKSLTISATGGGEALGVQDIRKEQYDDDTLYTGIAPKGTPESGTWKLLKLVRTTDPERSRSVYAASGSWTNRLTATYALSNTYNF